MSRLARSSQYRQVPLHRELWSTLSKASRRLPAALSSIPPEPGPRLAGELPSCS